MKQSARLWILILSVFAAITCYAMGLSSGMVIFIGLGIFFEVLFWGVFIVKKSPSYS
ncbi:hypothetical protein [Shewanella holmiensis]|jgi:uncharacterized membrane protein|uniref:Uncharacterized protein n=1 Tax=Shewanella holmiensis TaxID=2952222 RepID=A0A9X2WLA2_9GAMM|nr:hypothetical protein [Shewanella holmiensis]MCT7941452.1 hypothetical protein [Shewanella holmiensis]